MGISKSRIGRYALLRHKKYRDKEGLFLVQGEKAIKDTIPFFEIEALIVDPADIKKVSTLENLPEAIAVCRIPDWNRCERFFTEIKIPEVQDKYVLVLDGIQDPGNMGTIIRTAHWFGINNIFCSKDTVDIYNPKVVQATMGSIARVRVEYCNLEQLFEVYPEKPVYGLLMEGENIFMETNFLPGFILMGSEGHGPSPSSINHITKRLTIPPSNPSNRPDSLNVAIATAITLSQILK